MNIEVKTIKDLLNIVISRVRAAQVADAAHDEGVIQVVSVQSTKGISPLKKQWASAVSTFCKIHVECSTDPESNIIYNAHKVLANELKELESLVECEVMKLVKKHSDGTRSSSVSLKRKYYDDFCSELLTTDLFLGEEAPQIEETEGEDEFE